MKLLRLLPFITLSVFALFLFSNPLSVHAAMSDHFVITVDTTLPGSTPSNSFHLPGDGVSTYNFDVDVDNDGLFNGPNDMSSSASSGATIVFPLGPGTYTIRVQGTFPRIYFNNTDDKDKIISIDQWGTNSWTSMEGAFRGCSNLDLNATDTPDLSGVTSMAHMFRDASTFSPSGTYAAVMGTWNTSTVTDMTALFYGASDFNADISGWNTSSVTNMNSLFFDAVSFNQPLNTWDTSAVTNMNYMFSTTYGNSPVFNQSLSSWDTSSVTSMYGMFQNNLSFNQPLNTWDVGSVTSMQAMFARASAFNQPLNNWNTSAVTNMRQMFLRTNVFNQDISAWDTGAVTDMAAMFANTPVFNQPLNTWNVSSVTDMTSMFDTAAAFNQPLNNWNTNMATDMSYMFNDAVLFDQDISAWDISAVTNMSGMFHSITLSRANYDAILTGWSIQIPQTTVPFDGGNSTYCAVGSRAILTNAPNSWTITDGGLDASCPAHQSSSSSTTRSRNYISFPSFSTTPVTPTIPPSSSTCPTLSQNLRAGARDGVFHPYTNALVTEVKNLQTHLNRLGFAVGNVDGILGPLTDSAIKKMQAFFGTKADGFVGPLTRALVNTSCAQ